MESSKLMTREDVRKRWGVGLRTIDRLRLCGKLSWVDVSAGRGARPIVRFRMADILQFEAEMRLSADWEPGAENDASP